MPQLDAEFTPLTRWLPRAAERWPERTALEAPDGTYTYRALQAAVEAEAARLRGAGIVAGDRVGIAAARSADTIVAILATVQSGAGYVPLDTAYPEDRLRAMLDDARPRVVIGHAQARETLEASLGRLPSLAAPVPSQASFGAQPGLAYVLFTSGSTGRPKGVAMGEAPLAHLIDFHARHPRLGQAARTLQFAPLSFDVHFQEIFSTIATGGTLVMLDESERRDPERLHAALNALRIERVFLPYVALQMIADASSGQVPVALRDVISAGEQLQITPAIRSLFERLRDAELHNHYGPTESHVVTAFELRGPAARWPDIPPIGVALPHVQLALRDPETGKPTDADSGELLLGGDTLAHGYLGREDLTHERFRAGIAGLPGLWYLTGDLVRRDATGICTYLGRADSQLKIDGFRVEPGEIEVALMGHAAVREAVVTAPEVAGAGRQLVAYLVLRDSAANVSALAPDLRARVRRTLPEYMVPVRYIALDRLPTTPSGKIDRRALPVPAIEAPSTRATTALEAVRRGWMSLLGVDSLDDRANLFDLGARSLLVLRFVAAMKEQGLKVTVADVYDKPTVAGIAALVEGQGTRAGAGRSASSPRKSSQAVAIVGMATRTPGGADVEAFWGNLLAGREGIRHFSPEELDAWIPESVRSRPNFVAARGVLDDADCFDAGFFGISAREATVLDPQQRLMLELCWNALEHAGIDPGRADARIGVFAGTANNTYVAQLREQQPELVQQYGEFAVMLASEKDYVATRVANRLNLNGPAVSVHTACSTGLVAVAQAWHAVASGQCEIALAGGTTVVVPQMGGYLHVEGAMESADGHCRPFDADASGTVFASGGGVVVLKRLEDAQADGDRIYAVITGVGLNNDGGDKASFTAPSVTGQAGAIRMALDHAGVSARDIGYVEAHGTGTALGDPIELAALTRAWRADTDDSGYCGIGSLKSNLGHMVAAAGVVGLIKAALSLDREMIPGTIHYRRPNPQIDFAATPFHVVDHNTPWPRAASVRRAAVSSFGVGGTNAHLIVEEAPAPAKPQAADTTPTNRRVVLLPLSAQHPEGLLARAQQLAAALERGDAPALDAVAATLTRGRRAMQHRAAVAVRDVPEAVRALRALRGSTAATAAPRVVFLFPGQGSQHAGMARGLYEDVPAFREALDRCLQICDARLGVRLLPWLVEADPGDAQVAEKLAETRYAQPVLFSVSYSLAAWLDSLGIRAHSMIGHSIGEYAAACHAGVMSLEDAMNAVIARGEAMFRQPRGAMLAVRAPAEQVAGRLPRDVEIAACNAPGLTVVAGPHESIDSFAAALETTDVGVTRLKVSHAFHSASMDGALPAVEAALRGARLAAPASTIYSCISGEPLQAAEATDAGYWARQVRAPVQFSRAVAAELARGNALFVEVGPGQALTALVRQQRDAAGVVPRIVPLLGPAQDPGDPPQRALQALGSLWSMGVAVAWPVPASQARAVLPGYPFRRDRFWFKRREGAVAAAPNVAAAEITKPPLPVQSDVVEVIPVMSRVPAIENELRRILSDVSGISAQELDTGATFVDQGLDSLSLTQATLEIERVFGVKLRFRRMLEDLDTPAKLVALLDSSMPADKFAAAPPPAAAPVVAPAQAAPAQAWGAPTAPTMLLAPGVPVAGESLLGRQLQLIEEQLRLVRAMLPGGATLVPGPAMAPVALPAPAPVAAAPSRQALIEKPFGASARITLDTKQTFTDAQRRWLDAFTARYNARTGKSKSFSQAHRRVMSDPRVVTGFNPLWKDLVYPIVADRSKGARVWDIDGNEYIDLLSCFGANLLGYQPDDILKAMHAQLDAGIEVGPQHPLSADVARLISEFTGLERVAFCNTGSEAVMGAMRIARTVTGRKTIAIFTNSYHGIFDEVIVRGTKQLRSLSAAPGILANAVENVLVLDYASEDSLRILRERGRDLAAIMIEPIQNKYPTLQPVEFVRALRKIADDAECALIFDEVVTGFRLAPGGAQEFYGVRADIATYGKVIGGGLPFAAIAGGTRWLDALDGGTWAYGDDSYPEAGVTYFAGTFVRHPLALAAAHASLLHLKRGGRELYATLNGRTQSFIERLNAAFAERGAPVKAVHCASLWRLQWDDDQKFVSLFYYLTRFHGLHLYEQFGHFVTEAFGQAELDRVFDVFISSLDELMALQFITPRPGTGPRKQAALPSAPAAERPTAGRLAPGQTERWLAASFDAAAGRALNESFCVSLKGAVNRAALRQAVQDVTSRHDAFRLRFSSERPQQELGMPVPVPVAEVDLSHVADAERALDEFCTDASRTQFLLDSAPLARVSLLTLADGRAVVHVVASHLIFDGWASSVFNAELAAAYRARSAGLPPQLPPAESPIAFAEREAQRFESAEGQESLQYWTRALHQPPAAVQLGDRTPTGPRSFAADTQRVDFNAELTRALRGRARQSGATLFQLLLTAVTLLLRRRAAQDEFIVSIPYASQSLDRYGPLLADGVLDLPLRLGCAVDEPVEAVLKRVREQLMDALDHPLATQGTIARALGIRSAGDRPPLTGIYFNLNPKVDLSGFAPLAAEMHEGRKQGTLSELFFNFYEKADTLTLDLHYSTEFFGTARAGEIVAALHAVCAELAGLQATVVAGAAPAVDARLLRWNATETPFDPASRVEQWVSAQARRTPDAPAVSARGQTLTYRELDQQSNRYAQLLRARGAGPGDLVGLCLSRGPQLLPSLLGVLKTGAGYVPLDPGFPRDRLRYMAEDAAAKAVITEAQHADLSGVERARQVRVDDDATVIAGFSTNDPPAVSDVGGGAPAYVIYTSGSTGKPKGVAVPQRAVCNFLASMRRKPGMAAHDRLLAVTTLSFDIAVLELLLPLTCGAHVVLAQREDAMDGEALGALIATQGISLMQATPTTWHMLLDSGWTAPPRLRVLCGGEPLPPSLAARLLEQGVELWNMYGPTETTVWSTLAHVTDASRKITIGAPIDNTQVWILDEGGRPAGVGAEGEICIGGTGVALGYWRRPELTAEKFIQDPTGLSSTGLVYRTGDLGRWRDDGTLEHLGRLDFQVKIRGYRIELGEIEARLAALPGVARVVVVAREDAPGDVRLIGYVLPQSGARLDLAALREGLRGELPDYMLPQQLVRLEAMPLLPNGKIDRKSLPEPAPVAPSVAATAAIAPRTATERTVAGAMQTVLKLGAVGASDDFFALGGHSLLAARLISVLNKELGTQLNLRVLFESPTVERLATAIDRLRGGSEPLAPTRPPIRRRADQRTAPLTLMQERIRFMEEMHPGRVVYNAPSAHRLRGRLDVAAFDRAFREMIRRQPALRTVIVPGEAGGYVQEVFDAADFTLLPLEDLSHLSPEQREQRLAARIESLVDETFVLEQKPLFKHRLFRLGPEEHALFFMPHHVIWDGWSFDILYTEISALYEAYASGREPQLPEPPVTYGDFAAWHNEWMRSDEIRGQIEFWKKQYASGPLPQDPVSDLPRSRSSSGRGATAWMHLDRADTERIRDVAKATGSTMSIVALSVYSALMSQWLSDDKPVIGMPVRGRPSEDLEGVMGFFNNLLPVHLRVRTELSCLEWIRDVRQVVVEAFAHQDVPFELLAQSLDTSRRGAPARLYQVMFSFQDARQRPTQWGPLQHERVLAFQKGATEDLNLWMVEIPSGIEGGVQFNADLFLSSTAEALRDRFLRLLHRLVANPSQSLSSLLASDAADRAELAAVAVPVDATVPDDGRSAVSSASLLLAVRAQLPTTAQALTGDGQIVLDDGACIASDMVARVLGALRQQLRLRGSDTVLLFDDAPARWQLLLGALAIDAGASVQVLPASTLASGQRPAASRPATVAFASAAQWRELLASGLVGPAATAIVDAEQIDRDLAAALFAAGHSVWSVLMPGPARWPIAAGWVQADQETQIVGRALVTQGMKVTRGDDELPLGIVGDVVVHLELAGGATREVRTSVRARWRSDGLLQRVSADVADVTKGPARSAEAIGSSGDLRTATEQLLGEQWSRLLGVSAIRRSDNFFELGGTSLLAMQAINDVEKAIGRRVSAQRYPYETLAQIAAMYDAVSAKSAASTDAAADKQASGGVLRRIVGFMRGS